VRWSSIARWRGQAVADIVLGVIIRLQSVPVRGSQQSSDDLIPLYPAFETSLRGFDRRQVLEYLESLDGRIAMVTADRDAALAQVAELSRVLNHLHSESELLEYLRQEAARATSRFERMLESPMAEASVRIQRIMRLAEEEAAAFKANVEEEITVQRALADQEIAELRARVDQEIIRLRARVSSENESLFEHTKRHCYRLEADSARRQEVAEQEAAQAIAQREADASERLRSTEIRSIVRLHLMLQAVDEQLTTRISAVKRDEAALRDLRAQVAQEVTVLKALRAEVTEAVATTHHLLTEAIGQVRQTMIEHPDSSVCLPTQRGVDGGNVYPLTTGSEQRRSPHTSS
jgi:cell division septum initiation protein DivIVA